MSTPAITVRPGQAGTSRDPGTEHAARALDALHARTREALGNIGGRHNGDAAAIMAALDDLPSKAANARKAAEAWLNNKDIHPDGRKERAAAEVAAVGAELDKAADTLAARVEVLHAALVVEALPEDTMPQRAMLTRQDVLTVLEASEDKAGALMALATDPDPRIRALVAGPWGRRYARAVGVREDVMPLVMHNALSTTAKGTGPEAAAARGALSVKRAPVALAVSTARMMLKG